MVSFLRPNWKIVLVGMVCAGLSSGPVRSDAPVKNEQAQRLDGLGDPLSPGTVARLGTLRLWQGGTMGCVAFSPDGKILASGGLWEKSHPGRGGGRGASGSQTIWLWDAQSGRPLRKIPAPMGVISSLAFSSDSRLLAGGAFGGVFVLETASGKKLQEFKLPAQFLIANSLPFVCFSPDGNLAGGTPEKVLFWDLKSGKELKELVPPAKAKVPGAAEEKRYSAALSGDCKKTVWVSFADGANNQRNYSITLCETDTGKVLSRWEKLIAPFDVRRPILTPDGSRLAFGPGLWNTLNGKVILEVPPPGQDWIFTPDGKHLLAVRNDSFRTYVADSGRQVRDIPRVPRQAQGDHFMSKDALAFSADSKTLALGGAAIQLVDPITGKETLPLHRHLEKVTYVEFSRDGRSLYSGNPVSLPASNLQYRQWHGPSWISQPFAAGTEVFDHKEHSLAVSVQDRLMVAHRNGGLQLLDLLSGKEVRNLESNEANFEEGRFSPDGKILVLPQRRSKQFCFFQVESGKKIGQMPFDAARIGDCKFSPDGKLLAWSEADTGTVRLGNVASGKVLRRLGQKTQPAPNLGSTRPPCFFFSGDGQYLAWAWEVENAVHLAETATGKEVRRFLFPLERLNVTVFTGMVFSKDNRNLLVGLDGDPHVHVLEVASGGKRALLSGHQDGIFSLALSPDARYLASGSADTTILIWDMKDLLGKRRAVNLTQEKLAECWKALAADAASAYDALLDLVHAPAGSVPWLQKFLHPAPVVEPAAIALLIADLDSSQFKRRQNAMDELAKLADLAESALVKALAKKNSLEMRSRLEKLLDRVQNLPPSRLRELRALEVLETIGSPAARRVLESLGQGNPDALLTRHARAALLRWQESRKTSS